LPKNRRKCQLSPRQKKEISSSTVAEIDKFCPKIIESQKKSFISNADPFLQMHAQNSIPFWCVDEEKGSTIQRNFSISTLFMPKKPIRFVKSLKCYPC
jgi:hypothetical protein